MLRVWIVLGLVLLIGVALGLWLAARARRREQSSGDSRGSGGTRRGPSAPDDDPDFLRGLGKDKPE